MVWTSAIKDDGDDNTHTGADGAEPDAEASGADARARARIALMEFPTPRLQEGQIVQLTVAIIVRDALLERIATIKQGLGDLVPVDEYTAAALLVLGALTQQDLRAMHDIDAETTHAH